MAQTKARTVFVGNVPYDADEKEIRDILEKAGTVASFRLVFDKETKQPKGYGFCDYADPETAVNAIKTMSDVEFNGRRLRMDFADNVFGKGAGKGGGDGGGGAIMKALPALPGLSATSGPSFPLLPPPLQPAIAIAPGMVPLRPLAPGANLPDVGPDPIVTQRLFAEAMGDSVHTKIAQAIAALPQAHMQICLGAMQRLAKECPEDTRAMLQEHPQLAYGLLHAQLLLGLTLEEKMPPDDFEIQQLRAKAARRHAPPGYPGAPLQPAPPGMGLRPGAVLPGMMTMPARPPMPVIPGMMTKAAPASRMPPM